MLHRGEGKEVSATSQFSHILPVSLNNKTQQRTWSSHKWSMLAPLEPQLLGNVCFVFLICLSPARPLGMKNSCLYNINSLLFIYHSHLGPEMGSRPQKLPVVHRSTHFFGVPHDLNLRWMKIFGSCVDGCSLLLLRSISITAAAVLAKVILHFRFLWTRS